MIRYVYQGSGPTARSPTAPSYDKTFLLQLYRDMLRIRLIEEAIESRYREDHMKTPIHLVIGHEATAVGCCSALRRDDLIYTGHRTHGAYLAKGGDLKAMLSEMHCRLNGCVGSRGGSMHLMDKSVGMAGSSAIVGGSLPIATGAALAGQMQGLDRVCVVVLGDAATEEGVCSESLNFAALKKLPIIFFCENNFYSVQSPLATRQPPREIHKWAAGYGIAGIRVDGTNVLDVYEAAREAVKRAREGGGPTFIEAPVYRFRAHGGAGDDSQTGYRDPAEREAWERLCPVETYYQFLAKAGLIDAASRERLREEIMQEVLAAFKYA